MAVDSAGLQKTIDAIKATYGSDAVQNGTDFPPVPRISTGSLELDYATGGGIPIGRFSRFYGPYSSTKSLTCWNVVRNAQEMGMTVAYYNIEKQYDPVFTAGRGVDIENNFIIINGTIIEEIATKMEALMGSVHLHILDSCSAGVSTDELAAKPSDWRPGIGPRAWGKVWRRVGEVFDDRENTVILVDQIRKNWDTKADEPPGGKQMEHISSMTVHFKRGKHLYYDKDRVLDDTYPKKSAEPTLSGGIEADGIEINAQVRKSRVCRPFRTARMQLDLNSMEFDRLHELEKASRYFGVVETSGSWYKLPNQKKPIHGRPALRQAIAADESLQEVIREAALKASLG